MAEVERNESPVIAMEARCPPLPPPNSPYWRLTHGSPGTPADPRIGSTAHDSPTDTPHAWASGTVTKSPATKFDTCFRDRIGNAPHAAVNPEFEGGNNNRVIAVEDDEIISKLAHLLV